jgi:hydroxyacylglutathione hydrolase
MKIKHFTFNPIQENTYIVYNNADCVIIDPGCYERHEELELLAFIQDNNLTPHAVLNTHCHVDHILGNQFTTSHFGIPLYVHPLDIPTLQAVISYAHVYGLGQYKESPLPDFLLEDKQILNFGSLHFEVIFGPGHSPGHVAFYNEDEKKCLLGDILFKGSFGRVDLPGGNIDVLKSTIFNRFFTLPNDVTIFPGHGDTSTIGVEKRTNYILNF